VPYHLIIVPIQIIYNISYLGKSGTGKLECDEEELEIITNFLPGIFQSFFRILLQSIQFSSSIVEIPSMSFNLAYSSLFFGFPSKSDRLGSIEFYWGAPR